MQMRYYEGDQGEEYLTDGRGQKAWDHFRKRGNALAG